MKEVKGMKEYEIIIDKIENPDGGVVIVTGDGKGYMVRYTFSE